MKQHHTFQSLLQWLLLGLVAAPLLTGCNDSSTDDSPTPGPGTPSAVTFTITLGECNQQGVTLKVVPSDETATYYCNLYEAATFEGLSDDDIRKFLKGITETEAFLHTGTGEFTIAHTLTPGTQYRVLAAGYTPDTGFTEDFSLSEPFAVEAPQEPFLFEIKEVTYNSATILVKPLDATLPYFIDVSDAASVDKMGDEQLVEKLLSLYGGSMAMFFAYQGETTVSSGVDFSSAAAGDPTQNSFTFDVTDVGSNGADVTVTPSDPSVRYIWDVISEENYRAYGANDDGLRNYLNEYIESQISSSFPTREEVVAVVSVYGTNNYLYESLLPGTTYYVWAICVDDSGNPTADPALSESFTTAEEVISTATATLVFDKYYDGSELYKLDPNYYASYNGMAYVPATVERSADAVTWYTIYTSTNIMDTEAISDATLRSILVKQGTEGNGTPRYAVPWDTEVYFLAMAKDAEGHFGPVFRMSLTVGIDGVSPIEELTGTRRTAATPFGAQPLARQIVNRLR